MLKYNEFTYKKTYDHCKLEERFQKKAIFNGIYANSQIKRVHITRAACTEFVTDLDEESEMIIFG